MASLCNTSLRLRPHLLQIQLLFGLEVVGTLLEDESKVILSHTLDCHGNTGSFMVFFLLPTVYFSTQHLTFPPLINLTLLSVYHPRVKRVIQTLQNILNCTWCVIKYSAK